MADTGDKFGGADAYYLDEGDRSILAEMVAFYKASRGQHERPRPRTPVPPTENLTPETYIALSPLTGIPPLQYDPNGGRMDRPGYAECEIYRVLYNEQTPYISQVEGVRRKVLNLYNIFIPPWRWVTVQRDKYGSWIATDVGAMAGGDALALPGTGTGTGTGTGEYWQEAGTGGAGTSGGTTTQTLTGARVQASGTDTQTWVEGDDNKQILYNDIDIDTGGYVNHGSTSGKQKITIPSGGAGWYDVGAFWSADIVGSAISTVAMWTTLRLIKNGDVTNALYSPRVLTASTDTFTQNGATSTNRNFRLNASTRIYLADGDYIECWIGIHTPNFSLGSTALSSPGDASQDAHYGIWHMWAFKMPNIS